MLPASDAKPSGAGGAPTASVSFEAVLETQLGLQLVAKPVPPDLPVGDGTAVPEKPTSSQHTDGKDLPSAQAMPGDLLFLPVMAPAGPPGVQTARASSDHDEVSLDKGATVRRSPLPTLINAGLTEQQPQPEEPTQLTPSLAPASARAAEIAASLQGLPGPAPAESKDLTPALPDVAVPSTPVPNLPTLAETEPKPGASPAAPHVMAAVPGLVGDTRWGDALSQRVVWMAGEKLQAAEFRVEPPQLGPIEVRMSITNDQANLLFTAAHADARDAIQTALPRLQEMLLQSGLALGNVSIGAGGGQDQAGLAFQQHGSGGDRAGFEGEGASVTSNGTQLIAPARQGVGLVDLFA